MNQDSEPVRQLRRMLADMKNPDQETLLADNSILWLPLPVEGKRYYGMVFERLSPPAWDENDLKAMAPVGKIFSSSLRIFARQEPWYKKLTPRRKRVSFSVALAVLLLALFAVQVPLRIVAPCEVVASRPLAVNAPLDGVIKDMLVRPGQDVLAGEILFSYDGDVFREEVDVARKQVELARSNLERVMALAVDDRNARAEARLLDNRLSQEEVRLDSALRREERLDVTAPGAGTVVMGDPAEFSGRPVRIGEPILLLADQADQRLRIWLPQDDRIEFNPQHGVRVFLNADAGRSRRAQLDYVAAHAQAGPEGIYGFMAVAEGLVGVAGIKLGLRGTAVLYGEDVSLGYWLARKPLAAVRRFLGI